MPKKHSYEKLRLDEELQGRINIYISDPKNPYRNIGFLFGSQPEDMKRAKLICESWNAVVSIAERLDEDPLRIARKLQRGELLGK
jgi:hypothetical protein